MIRKTAVSCFYAAALALAGLVLGACAGTPPAPVAGAPVAATPAPPARPGPVAPPVLAPRNFPVSGEFADVDARETARRMGMGINLGNTFDNTAQWETGWGQPVTTREFIHALAAHGYGVVRLPVAWDTYAVDGVIQEDKFARVGEVVDWILAEGMYCVLNIHWDGGWIDSGDMKKFPGTYHTFSAEAEGKFKSYWTRIATRFAGRNERLVFEGLNEESNFTNEGGTQGAYETLLKVNQLFLDTVRATGGNNSRRVLVVAGYTTDFAATSDERYMLPEDSAPDRMMVSVHYYTPSTFAILEKDASWGKAAKTWGSPHEKAQLADLFARMHRFSQENGVPVFVGEFGLPMRKESASRIKWFSAVIGACREYGFVPVLWDAGGEVSKRPPYRMTGDMQETFRTLGILPRDN